MEGFSIENMDVDSYIQSLLLKYVTARIDIKNIGDEDNSILIISNSDSTAKIIYNNFINDEKGSGLTIQSSKCFLYLELKCRNEGLLNIKLMGTYNKSKNNKALPIYIDFMKLMINDEDYLEQNQVAWHNKPFTVEKEVEDGEIVKLYIEWLPLNDLSSL